METIMQGRSNSICFTILQPVPGCVVSTGTEVLCIDPRSNKQIKGRCIDRWSWLWSEIPDAFCKLTYGINAQELKTALEKKPEFQNISTIKFCLIEPIQ